MREVEVKFLEIDVEDMIQKLEALGATKLYEGPTEAIYYDTITHDLDKRGRRLRIRKAGEEVTLTAKQKLQKDSSKVSEEFETSIGDYETAKKIFDLLGYVPRKDVNKTRISYKHNNTKCEIDIFDDDDIPPLMEIEAEDIEDIKETAKDLSLDMNDAKDWGGNKVIAYYKGEDNK